MLETKLPSRQIKRLRGQERERDEAVRALQDIAGSRPVNSDGRLLRARARDCLDQLGVTYRGAEG